MKLRYHLSKNFGDALNPFIFNHFLPDFFDNNEDVEFVGIGSILGFKTIQKAAKKIVFSSGFAYGSIPELDSTYDIKCVRGPLTCKALNLDKKYAIADGAILLQYMPLEAPKPNVKEFDFSFMPHWESALKFDWKSLCERMGIHYINPTNSISDILKDIRSSKTLIAEAMHGAIVADTLRVPWIPVKAYAGINTFKWQDWSESLNLPYEPINIRSIYNNSSFTRKVIKEKTGYPFKRSTLSPFLKIYESGQRWFIIDNVIATFEKIKAQEPYLSDDSILRAKGDQLLEKLEEVKAEYCSR